MSKNLSAPTFALGVRKVFFWRMRRFGRASFCLLHHVHGAVIVAMVAVRMMEVSFDEIVNVVAVWNRLVATTVAVYMILCVSRARVLGGTRVWVCRGYVESVFLHLFSRGMMEVAIMQEIDVVPMFDGGVAATFPVLVLVVTLMAIAHSQTPSPRGVMTLVRKPIPTQRHEAGAGIHIDTMLKISRLASFSEGHWAKEEWSTSLSSFGTGKCNGKLLSVLLGFMQIPPPSHII